MSTANNTATVSLPPSFVETNSPAPQTPQTPGGFTTDQMNQIALLVSQAVAQATAPATAPKRRGRPTKAQQAAKEKAAQAAQVNSPQSPTPTPTPASPAPQTPATPAETPQAQGSEIVIPVSPGWDLKVGRYLHQGRWNVQVRKWGTTPQGARFAGKGWAGPPEQGEQVLHALAQVLGYKVSK